MGGQTTYLPIKVNTAGVVPIIFASALLYFPAGSRMKILNEVIKEKPDSKHIDLCCNGVQF